MKALFFFLNLFLFTCTYVEAEFFFTQEMIKTHLAPYSEKELELIQKDLGIVHSICLGDATKSETPFYLATAGAPGSRKTTILEKFISTHSAYQEGVYLDFDPRTLRYMAHTYYATSLTPLVISQTGDYDQVLKNAYQKWRAASNYIVLTLFEEAALKGCSIIFGTTSTGAHMPHLFAKLKEKGYKIILLLCSCPDEMRYQAVDHRNKVIRFYQSSPEDALTKGKLFPQRMSAYFAYADVIYLYWSDALFSEERLAAVWEKGNIAIHDPEAMNHFIEKYEADRAALAQEGCSIPAFDTYLH